MVFFLLAFHFLVAGHLKMAAYERRLTWNQIGTVKMCAVSLSQVFALTNFLKKLRFISRKNERKMGKKLR